MSVFDGKHVIAVNASGEKQEIPTDWLGHPVLGKGFTETPSAKARKPRGDQDPKPVGEGETKEKKDA